jgi:hypothetical protein
MNPVTMKVLASLASLPGNTKAAGCAPFRTCSGAPIAHGRIKARLCRRNAFGQYLASPDPARQTAEIHLGSALMTCAWAPGTGRIVRVGGCFRGLALSRFRHDVAGSNGTDVPSAPARQGSIRVGCRGAAEVVDDIIRCLGNLLIGRIKPLDEACMIFDELPASIVPRRRREAEPACTLGHERLKIIARRGRSGQGAGRNIRIASESGATGKPTEVFDVS